MIIKIEPNDNGSHINQSTVPKIIPDGWALVPSDMEIPDTFPFMNIEVNDGIVTSMTAGIVPEPEPLEPEPQPSGDTESRLLALEKNKADKDDITAITAAIERGLAL